MTAKPTANGFWWLEAILHTSLPTPTKLVASVLFSHLGQQSGECGLATATIMAEASIRSRTTVRTALDQLEACELLVIHAEMGQRAVHRFAAAFPDWMPAVRPPVEERRKLHSRLVPASVLKPAATPKPDPTRGRAAVARKRAARAAEAVTDPGKCPSNGHFSTPEEGREVSISWTLPEGDCPTDGHIRPGSVHQMTPNTLKTNTLLHEHPGAGASLALGGVGDAPDGEAPAGQVPSGSLVTTVCGLTQPSGISQERWQEAADMLERLQARLSAHEWEQLVAQWPQYGQAGKLAQELATVVRNGHTHQVVDHLVRTESTTAGPYTDADNLPAVMHSRLKQITEALKGQPARAQGQVSRPATRARHMGPAAVAAILADPAGFLRRAAEQADA